MPTLAEQLRKARADRKLSLRALAAVCGYSFGFISDLEQGTRNGSEEVLRNIAKALGIPAEPLVKASKAERVVRIKQRAEQQIAELSA